jgi:RimJ/RimL family protein N-acetyltransferase
VVGDPYAMRFYPKPFDRSMARAWIERTQERYERDGFGLLSVVERATGEMIGDCGPAVQQTGHGTFVELGWHIRLDRQGNGFATEAGRACRDQAWKALDVDRLISIIRPENVPSWSVARALGFRPGAATCAPAWRTSCGRWNGPQSVMSIRSITTSSTGRSFGPVGTLPIASTTS